MDKPELVKKDMEDGKKLILALDNSTFQVVAALWFYDNEDGEWRLIVASPLVEEKGTKEAYAFIQKKIARLSPIGIALRQISVISPNNDLIKLLKVAIRTGNVISGVRFTHNTINNVFIEDAYIYCVR